MTQNACLDCGNPFEQFSSRHVRCSKCASVRRLKIINQHGKSRCQKQAALLIEQRPERKCSECPALIPKERRAGVIYCSQECRAKAGIRQADERCKSHPEALARRRAKNKRHYAKRQADGRHRTAKRDYYRNNLNARIAKSLRDRIRGELRKVSGFKSARTMALLGCSIESFKLYIAAKLLPGMSWENYNWDSWHLDHIRPCASFDLSKPEEQSACFHFSNLQPLWKDDNFKKGDTWMPN